MHAVSQGFLKQGTIDPTHRYNNTEQPADNLVHHTVQFRIASLGAIQCPICMLFLHAEAEEVWFGNNEVEILVVELRNMFGCARIRRLCREIFEKDPRYRGEEVDVRWGIEPLLEVVCDGGEVLGSRFGEVYDGDIGDGVPRSSDVPMRSVSMAKRQTGRYRV